MRIGILTFHCSYNFGAVLQCYALQEYLISLGHNVKIINYRPKYLIARKPKINCKYIIKHPHLAYSYIAKQYPLRKKKYLLFESFEKENYKLTQTLQSKEEVEEAINEFDFVIFGSDQIWCEKFNGMDSLWYGGINHNEKTRFITYAASAGDVLFSDRGAELMKVAEKRFSAISVREQKLANYIQRKTDVVLDPTLMIPETIYEKWYEPIIKEKYILVRQARKDSYIYIIAKAIAKQLDAKIITADMHSNSFFDCDNVIACSPSEFVSLIRNSLCVISNSFHGVAVAIASQTPFYATRLYDGGDERIMNILDMIGLSERVIEKGVIPRFSKIDYAKINEKLNKYRKESQQFLIKQLS